MSIPGLCKPLYHGDPGYSSYEEAETLCSECGKPCDDPTCKLCLEGIAEMIALMEEPVESESAVLNFAAAVVGFFLFILVCL